MSLRFMGGNHILSVIRRLIESRMDDEPLSRETLNKMEEALNIKVDLPTRKSISTYLIKKIENESKVILCEEG